MEARSFWVTVMKLLGFITKGFWIWIGFGFTLFLLTTGIFTLFAGDQVQSLSIGEITDRAEQISFQDHNSNFAHRFSLCTLKIQYWQLFSYLNSYAMLLEAVSSVKQVPCS